MRIHAQIFRRTQRMPASLAAIDSRNAHTFVRQWTTIIGASAAEGIMLRKRRSGYEDMPTTRPLSPHLDIYRWRVNMLQSVLHRLTGLFLSLGALLVTWGLIAAASSGKAWDIFATFCTSWVGLILLFLWTWSLLFHLCNGIQHLLRDSGRGFGPAHRDRAFDPSYWKTGWIVIAISVALAVLVFVLLVLRMGGGAA